ncbi:MAG: DNA gyrase inhibitor YacG [Proteobacteria bacterium]|nr:DNA gyrase inhibitor YacG [Pseudomonadota bacterium]
MKKTTLQTIPPIPQTTTVACPQCGASVAWAPTSRWKPFCSERCKQLDLGAWADESYRIASVETADASEIENALTAFPPDLSRPH